MIKGIACVALAVDDLCLLSDNGKPTSKRVFVKAAFKSVAKRLESLIPKRKYILVGREENDTFFAERIELATGK